MSKPPSQSTDKDGDPHVLALDDFRATPSVDDQAIAWIAKLSGLTPEHSDNEAISAEFEAWFNAHPDHALAFEHASALWGIAEIAAASPRVQMVSAYRRSLASVASLAAMVLVMVMVLVASPTTYQTAPGEQQRIILADGSTAFLNTDSTIEVSMLGHQRVIRLLKGEVWFDVAHDPARPFRVTANDVVAQALGTAYAVRRAPEGVLVTVTDGSVEVSRQSLDPAIGQPSQQQELTQVVELRATEQLLVPITRSRPGRLAPTKLRDIDIAQALAWQRGLLVYEDMPLSDVLLDLNRYVPTNMALSDERVGDSHVNAIIQISDQTAMLEALSISMGLNWKTVSDELILITPRTLTP